VTRAVRTGVLCHVLFAIGVVAGCNLVTGESTYSSIDACTGPLCDLSCQAKGGSWHGPPANACTCQNGPLCGGSSGTCCGGTAPHCVFTGNGGERCSACTKAEDECGSVCCEGQTCLSAALGACGARYGQAHQSCGSGLVCPVPDEDGGVEQADCCDAIPLPGGTFTMGLQLNGKNRCVAALVGQPGCTEGDESPPHPVTLSPYSLDRFEVTVGRFRSFLDEFDYAGLPAGAGGYAKIAGAGWQSEWNGRLPTSKDQLAKDVECLTTPFMSDATVATWTEEPGTNELLPINCVSWYEAFAFCVWDGGRLPTEAEWEYAAANGASTDLFPWGQALPTPDLAVYDCTEDAVPCTDPPNFFHAVGSLPHGDNVWGHRDLAGNVSEWVLDTWGPYPTQAVTNYADVEADGLRVGRGGGGFDPPVDLRAAARAAGAAGVVSPEVGFRCARSP
jgi:formylglycine-generating enzyme